eukprot:COSAG02_NODE_1744_length_11100_cov_6.084083_11_plen_61_part_00
MDAMIGTLAAFLLITAVAGSGSVAVCCRPGLKACHMVTSIRSWHAMGSPRPFAAATASAM